MWKHLLCIAMLASVAFSMPGPVFAQDSARGDELVILATGQSQGDLYPVKMCGQPDMGGMSRRQAELSRQRAEGAPIALFSAGNELQGFGGESEPDPYRQDMVAETLEMMGYDAWNIGVNELEYAVRTPEFALPATAFSSNLRDMATGKPWKETYKMVKVGGATVGVLGVAWVDELTQFFGGETETVFVVPPQEALASAMKELPADLDALVLLADVSMDVARELMNAFPRIDVALVSEPEGEEPQIFEGRRIVLPAPVRGIGVGYVRLQLQDGQPRLAGRGAIDLDTHIAEENDVSLRLKQFAKAESRRNKNAAHLEKLQQMPEGFLELLNKSAAEQEQ